MKRHIRRLLLRPLALENDARGGLWVGTVDGLLHLEDGKLKRDGLPAESVTALAQDKDGGLWIGTAGAGLVHYKDGAVTRPGAREGLSGSNITTLYVDRRGDLWIGTSDIGLLRREGDRFITRAGGDAFPDAPVLRVFDQGDGTLWFGTRGGGLVRKTRESHGSLTVYGIKDGLPSDVVNDVLIDRDGNLLLGTSKGIARLRGGRAAALSLRRGVPIQDARQLLEDAEGSVWVGTEMGGLARLRDGDFTTYTVEEGLAHDMVRSIVEDSSGSVWIGTEGGGLSQFDRGVFRTSSTKEGLAADVIWGLFEDSNKTLWAGSFGGGISRRQNGELKTISKADGLPVDIVTSFAEHDGALWLGSDGLVRYKDGVFTVWGPERGMPKTRVNSLLEDRSGTLWICTLASGLGRMRDSLTGLFTHRYFQTVLASELARAAENGRKLGFLLLDVDHLHAFNERCGRGQGDGLLRQIAMVVGGTSDPALSRARGRAPEVGCRHGGGELALLLPDADLDATRARGESIRGLVHSNRFMGGEGQPGRVVSVSVGAASFPQCASRQDQLVEAAVRALRQAKLAGRNRVEIARALRIE